MITIRSEKNIPNVSVFIQNREPIGASRASNEYRNTTVRHPQCISLYFSPWDLVTQITDQYQLFFKGLLIALSALTLHSFSRSLHSRRE